MNIYHYDTECRLNYQTEATYDILDNTINVPALATTKEPLGASYPDLDVFDINENCWTIEKYIEPPKPDEPIPPTIEELRTSMILTPAQFKLNLVAADLFNTIHGVILSLPSSDPASILWFNALQFERLNPVLIELGNSLGYDDDKLDAVFTMKAL